MIHHTYELSVKIFKDVHDHEKISADPSWTLTQVDSLVRLHNSGAINLTNILSIGSKDCYMLTPINTPVIVWRKIQ